MPKISVIIPVYGVEKYIERCARSLFEQTLDDIEFIFVDDCTPDRSVEILSQIIEEYRLRFAEMNYVVRTERMPTNSGLPAVRRHGIQLCTGDYIIHCDSDDWVDVTMYEKLYNKAIADDLDIVYCDYYESDGVNKQPFLQQYKDDASYLMSHYITVWNKLTKRTLWLNENFIYPTGNMGEDRVFTIQLVHAAKRFGYVKEYLYYYYINPDSLCHKMSQERAIRNYKSRKLNTELICKFYSDNEINDSAGYLTELKLATINWLKPYLKNNECAALWLNTYPTLTKEIMSCRGISLRSKISFLKDYLYLHIKH